MRTERRQCNYCGEIFEGTDYCPECGGTTWIDVDDDTQQENQRRSEIIYFDENGRIVDKNKAAKAVIRELDENGNLIREVFGVINHEEAAEVTDEEFDSFSGEYPEIEVPAKEDSGNVHVVFGTRVKQAEQNPEVEPCESGSGNSHIVIELDSQQDDGTKSVYENPNPIYTNEDSGINDHSDVKRVDAIEPKKCNSRKKAGIFAGVAVAVILIAVLGWCGINYKNGKAAYENAQYEQASQLLHKDFLFSDSLQGEADYQAGQTCFDRGDYAAAAEYYAKCGAAAAHEMHLSRGKNAVLLKDYQTALDEFAQCNVGNERTTAEDEAHMLFGETLESENAYEKALEQYAQVKDRDKRIKAEDNVYLTQGKNAINDGKTTVATNMFSKCQENSEGKTYADILRDLQSKNYLQGAEKAKKASDTYSSKGGISQDTWYSVFKDIIGFVNRTDPNAFLLQSAALKCLNKSNNSTAGAISGIQQEVAKNGVILYGKGTNKAGVMIDVLTGYSRSTMEELDHSCFLLLDSFKDLYATAGSEANGKKILIVQQNHHLVKDSERSYGIATEMMDCLPYEYYPASIEEAEYVMEIKYDFDPQGRYDGGVRSGRPKATIYVYKMPGQKNIYQSSLVYGGNTPISIYLDAEYVAGTAPDLNNPVEAALNAVFNS